MSLEVLLADDDDSLRLVLSKAFSRAGHTVRATDNATTLLKWIESGRGDVVVTDVLMNGREVFDILPDVAKARPDMPVIVISANNTVATAIKSGEHAVFEYVPKPFDLDALTGAVTRASQGVGKGGTRRARRGARVPDLPMVGRSSAMQPVFRALSRYSNTALPTLITGDVGTGKELVARLLHEGGARKSKPFLRGQDLSNLSLVLQKVNGGTLFIDEVAGLSHDQQSDLMALMTEIEMIPEAERPRVIATTRKDLRAETESGAFRDDLFYRINVAEIHLPPLSARREDVGELATHFLERSDRRPRRLEADALDVMSRHDWPGNVRELENIIKRLAVLYSDEVITAVMVLDELDKNVRTDSDADGDALAAVIKVACRRLVNRGEDGADGTPHQVAVGWVEKPLIEEALRVTGGNRAKAADILGIHRNTLRARTRALGID